MTDYEDQTPPPQHPDGSDATGYTLSNRIDDESQTSALTGLLVDAQTKGKMGDKLIDTGIWKRHQGAYPPAKYPDHYMNMDRKGSWDAR